MDASRLFRHIRAMKFKSVSVLVLFVLLSVPAARAEASAPTFASRCVAVGPRQAKAWMSEFDLVFRSGASAASLSNIRVNPQSDYGNELGSLLQPYETSARNADYRPKEGSRYQNYLQYKDFPISSTQWISSMQILIPTDFTNENPSSRSVYAVWNSRDGIFSTDEYLCN